MRAKQSTPDFDLTAQPFLLLLAFTLLSRPITAQTTWSSFNTGLYGASVRGFALDSQGSFVAATNGGIYYMEATGRWRLTRGGGDAGSVFSLGNGAFLAGIDRIIYRSDDAGISWRKIDSGIYARSFGRVRDGAILVAGGHGSVVVTATQMRRSTDEGESWHPIEIVPDLNGDVAFAEGKNHHILAGTLKGVFLSSDEGETWNPTTFADSVYDLEVSDGTLYAASPQGIFVTYDEGTSWSLADTLRARTLLFDQGSLFAVVGAGVQGGLYRRDEPGGEWSRLTAVVPRDVALDRKGNLWLAVGTLPLYSSDHGASWLPGERGMTSTDVGSLMALGDNLFAIVRSALYRYTADDSEWRLLEQAPMISVMRSAFIATQATHVLLAIARESLPEPGERAKDALYVSADSGLTWTRKVKGGIMTLPSCDNRGLGTVGFAEKLGSAVRGGGLMVTTDAGTTWDSTSLHLSIVSTLVANGRIFAGSIESDGERPTSLGTFSSSDSGRSWVPISTEVGARAMATIDGESILAITAHRVVSDGDTLLSSDVLDRIRGDEVETILSDTIPVSFIVTRPGLAILDAVLPDGRTVTIRAAGNGLRWSTIAVDGRDGGRLTAAIAGAGGALLGIVDGSPATSLDNGATWTTHAGRLPRSNASVAAHQGSGYYVLGTSGDGLFASADLLEAPVPDRIPTDRPVRLRITGNEIEITSDRPRSISLDMTDVLGRRPTPIIDRLLVDRTIRIPLPFDQDERRFYLIRARWNDGAAVVTGVSN